GTFRAEFLPSMPGLESFTTCFKRAKRIKFDGNGLVVIGYDDLIVNEKTLGRDVDRQDIEQLQKRNPRGPQPRQRCRRGEHYLRTCINSFRPCSSLSTLLNASGTSSSRHVPS